jgi:hypothetical protein
VKARTAFALLAVSLAVGAGNARADNPVLIGDVGLGDAFQISLVDSSGVPVKHLDAGTYTLVVHGHSVHHNFHLTGPGVDVATPFAVADQTFTITLGDGVYTFVCDPHQLTMRGVFTVGSVTAPPPSKLTASFAGGSKTALGPLSSPPPAGTYVISVHDRSAKDGFRIAGPGVSRSTGARFTGTVKWTVTLRKGTYEYGSARFSKLRRFFTVFG